MSSIRRGSDKPEGNHYRFLVIQFDPRTEFSKFEIKAAGELAPTHGFSYNSNLYRAEYFVPISKRKWVRKVQGLISARACYLRKCAKEHIKPKSIEEFLEKHNNKVKKGS